MFSVNIIFYNLHQYIKTSNDTTVYNICGGYCSKTGYLEGNYMSINILKCYDFSKFNTYLYFYISSVTNVSVKTNDSVRCVKLQITHSRFICKASFMKVELKLGLLV